MNGLVIFLAIILVVIATFVSTGNDRFGLERIIPLGYALFLSTALIILFNTGPAVVGPHMPIDKGFHPLYGLSEEINSMILRVKYFVLLFFLINLPVGVAYWKIDKKNNSLLDGLWNILMMNLVIIFIGLLLLIGG